MASELPKPKGFDRDLLPPEERALFESAGEKALELTRSRLKEAWEKRQVSQSQPSVDPEAAATTLPQTEAPQDSHASDVAATTAGGERDNNQSKVVADLISRPGVIDSPMFQPSLTKEWEDFLARPDGQETADMLKDIITEQWKEFDQKMSQEGLDRKVFVSKKKKAELWQSILLPQLKEMITKYLDEQKSIPRRNGRLIFRAIIRELEGAAENKE